VKHRLFQLEALEPGGKRVVEVDRRRILVVRTGAGEVHALADNCPHQGARLSDGVLGGEFTAKAPGLHEIVRDGEVVRCPWHNFAFDVKTGRCLLDPARYRVKVYPVTIEDDAVVLET
jgi:nitrite reductase/ring-hydroxylating ferredoxin subunit